MTLLDSIEAWQKCYLPFGFKERKGHVAPETVRLSECAERIAELEAALKPFIRLGDKQSLYKEDGTIWKYVQMTVLTADIMAARKALGFVSARETRISENL